MDMSPNQVRTATFTTVRKGWDPAEVAAFLERAADALEQAQNHATAMEARARAAVAKLQDLTSAEAGPGRAPAAPDATPAAPATVPSPTDDEREIISRTLLLAQRAADEAVSEARAEAQRLVDEARESARREGADERQRIRDEVDALSARRGFLQSDVEHLENFLLDQRERLRSAAASLVDMAEKVPGGLGYLRPPLLSAGDEPIAGPPPGAIEMGGPDDTPAASEHDPEAGTADAEPTPDVDDEPLVILVGDDAPGDPTPQGLPQDHDAR